MKRIASIRLLALIPFLHFIFAGAQAGVIKGQVVDAMTGHPISGALVLLKEKPALKAVSTGGGNFTISQVPTGIYTVITQDERYLPASVEGYDMNVASTSSLKLLIYSRQVAVLNGKEFVDLKTTVAAQLLNTAKKTNDTEAVYLLSNTLAFENPQNGFLANQALEAEEALRKQPALVFGSLFDKDGGSVLGATLIFSEIHTGQTFTIQSLDGTYSASLFPGTYKLRVNGQKVGLQHGFSNIEIQAANSKIFVPMEIVRALPSFTVPLNLRLSF